MASSSSASIAEEFVDERLLVGLYSGSLLQHKELLDLLKDVDSRIVKERTLLHVGVRLGKSDWVQELLARGANPDLTDDKQMNSLSSAEEMVRLFPEDTDRSQVLKMVSLVHRRDQVMMGRLESSSSRSTDHTTPEAGHGQYIESLKSSVDDLRREMKALVQQLSSSLEELKAQVCGRDALLHCLEKAVTSTAEDVTSIKCGLSGETSLSQPTFDPARARQECVDAMMRKTWIVYGSGANKMRRLYERLYDGDECSACIIKYLSGGDWVRVMVDLESENIGRMKKKVVYLDGTLGNVSGFYTFCDFKIETVYLGANDCSGDREKAVCAWLAWSLLQLSLQLVFDNEGRPYCKGDVEREREWMRAIEEVEERRKRGERLDWCINDALNRKSLKLKVCWLATAVPRIIVYHGSTEGKAILQQEAPFLLSLYSNNVMGTLIASAKR